MLGETFPHDALEPGRRERLQRGEARRPVTIS